MKRVLLVLALLVPVDSARAQQAVRCADESFYVRCSAMIPMSDGVGLDSSLYVPKSSDGRLPVIVRQHGGGSNKDNGYDLGWGLEAVETGNFALVMYSHRGHGNSEGLFDFFGPRTTQDFSEVLDFWGRISNAIDTSNVGVSGYSQGGGESLLPAAFDSRVKAVAVGNTFNDLNQALNPNDCFKESIATAIFALAYKISASRTQDDLAIRWGLQLNTETEDVALGPLPSTRSDLASRSPLTFVDRIQAPVFWTQSWEDPLFPADMPETYLSQLESRGIPVHYYFSSGGHFAGPDFPADLELKERSIIDWFDEFLRGADHGFASGTRPKAEWWQRTAPGPPGAWAHHTAPAWPIPGAAATSFYPSPLGTLDTAPPAGESPVGTVVNDLVSANVAHDAAVLTAADAIGIGSVVRSVPEGANPLDTATYASAPLARELDVTGAPVVHLPANTTALRSAQIAAKVWDVTEGGATLVSRGCLSHEEFTGGLAVFDFSLWPNSHRFAQGHRVVLTLSAVDMPAFRNDFEPAVTSILQGARLDLPVTP